MRTPACRRRPRSRRRPRRRAAACGIALRTRRIIDTNCVTVSWVATAPSNNVESSARRVLFANTFVSAITSRTALKIRSGRSETAEPVAPLRQHRGMETQIGDRQPAATFHRRSVASSVAVTIRQPFQRLQNQHRRITSAGCDGRPRPDGKRSANVSSGNRRWRCSARNAYTESSGTRCDTNAAASNNSRSDPTFAASPNFRLRHRRSRAFPDDCSAVS